MAYKNEIEDMLQAYHDGTKTFEEVAEFLKNYDWPAEKPSLDTADAVYTDMYTDELPDTTPGVDDIYGASLRDVITYDDYRKFNKIAYAAMKGKENA